MMRMTNLRSSWALPLAVSLAGCGQPTNRSADPAEADRSMAEARAGVEVNGIVAAAQVDADQARIGSLENQVAELSARVDTSSSAVLEARIAALEAQQGATPDPAATALPPTKQPRVPLPPSTMTDRPIPPEDTR